MNVAVSVCICVNEPPRSFHRLHHEGLDARLRYLTAAAVGSLGRACRASMILRRLQEAKGRGGGGRWNHISRYDTFRRYKQTAYLLKSSAEAVVRTWRRQWRDYAVLRLAGVASAVVVPCGGR